MTDYVKCLNRASKEKVNYAYNEFDEPSCFLSIPQSKTRLKNILAKKVEKKQEN